MADRYFISPDLWGIEKQCLLQMVNSDYFISPDLWGIEKPFLLLLLWLVDFISPDLWGIEKHIKSPISKLNIL